MWRQLSDSTFDEAAENVATMIASVMEKDPEIVEMSGTVHQPDSDDGRVVVVQGPNDLIAMWIALDGPPYVASAVWEDA